MGWKNIKILAPFLLLLACVKDKPNTVTSTNTANGNVYIVCEGNFGNGDGTLYSYNSETDSVYSDLFRNANAQPLGDVFQSINRIGDSLYLCINNSDKILVLNALDKSLSGVISLPKPRYILPVSNTVAYVSSLYNNKVYIINPKTIQITGTVSQPYINTEGLCLNAGTIYIAVWDTSCSQIYATDAFSNSISKTININSFAPHDVLIDKEQMLWVLSGNPTKGRPSALYRIDPSTGNILKEYKFDSETDAIKPVFNATKDTLYFIAVKYDGTTKNNGIYRMNISANELPSAPFVQAEKYQYFWALGIAPSSGYIYVGDPKGFTQKGVVTIYKQDGTIFKTFKTGVGPGQFYFSE